MIFLLIAFILNSISALACAYTLLKKQYEHEIIGTYGQARKLLALWYITFGFLNIFALLFIKYSFIIAVVFFPLQIIYALVLSFFHVRYIKHVYVIMHIALALYAIFVLWFNASSLF